MTQRKEMERVARKPAAGAGRSKKPQEISGHETPAAQRNTPGARNAVAPLPPSTQPAAPLPPRRPASRTLTTDLFEQIRSDILHNRLEPGSRLLFRDMRERYRSGLSPLREALMRLVSEGLVLLEDHKGSAWRRCRARR